MLELTDHYSGKKLVIRKDAIELITESKDESYRTVFLRIDQVLWVNEALGYIKDQLK